MLGPDRSILDELPDKPGQLRRGWREVLRDAWMAFRGKTFVTMRGYCFHCREEFNLEAYQDCVFPTRARCACPDPVRFDMMAFNSAHYFPTELMRVSPSEAVEFKTGDHLTFEEAEALERRVGYGSKWWEKSTVKAVRDRAAIRREHEA